MLLHPHQHAAVAPGRSSHADLDERFRILEVRGEVFGEAVVARMVLAAAFAMDFGQRLAFLVFGLGRVGIHLALADQLGSVVFLLVLAAADDAGRIMPKAPPPPAPMRTRPISSLTMHALALLLGLGFRLGIVAAHRLSLRRLDCVGSGVDAAASAGLRLVLRLAQAALLSGWRSVSVRSRSPPRADPCDCDCGWLEARAADCCWLWPWASWRWPVVPLSADVLDCIAAAAWTAGAKSGSALVIETVRRRRRRPGSAAKTWPKSAVGDRGADRLRHRRVARFDQAVDQRGEVMPAMLGGGRRGDRRRSRAAGARPAAPRAGRGRGCSSAAIGFAGSLTPGSRRGGSLRATGFRSGFARLGCRADGRAELAPP